MREILIVGVDPGTTAGWAALNKRGELVSIGSRKGIAPNELTETLRDIGKIVIIGTDKAKTPALIKSISARFKAKTVYPKKDLKRFEKKELANGEVFLNDHEQDALAAAKFAFKKYHTLFRKAKSYVDKYSKHELEDKIIEKVLKGKCSITAAVLELEKKEPVKKIEEKKTEAKIKIETVLRKENLALRKMINKLQKRVKELDIRIRKNKKKTPVPKEQLLMQKGQIITNLRKELEQEKINLQKAKEKQEKLLEHMINSEGKIIIKCLPNLGMQALEKIKLKKNEVLYVEDPNCFSENAVERLKKLEIDRIIHSKALTRKVKKILPFVFISVNQAKLERFEDVIFLEKKILKQNKPDVLKKVLHEYQTSRRKL